MKAKKDLSKEPVYLVTYSNPDSEYSFYALLGLGTKNLRQTTTNKRTGKKRKTILGYSSFLYRPYLKPEHYGRTVHSWNARGDFNPDEFSYTFESPKDGKKKGPFIRGWISKQDSIEDLDALIQQIDSVFKAVRTKPGAKKKPAAKKPAANRKQAARKKPAAKRTASAKKKSYTDEEVTAMLLSNPELRTFLKHIQENDNV